jgi:hypothetical protein
MGRYHHPVYSALTSARCDARTEPRTADQLPGARRSGSWATAARDIPPGSCWAFTDHRSMAQIIADEKAPTA